MNNENKNNNQDEMNDVFGLFEAGDENLWAEALAASNGGGARLDEERQKIVDSFDLLTPGKSFVVPVPAGYTAKDYRTSIHNMLTQQNRGNRKVLVVPGQNKIIIGLNPKKGSK